MKPYIIYDRRNGGQPPKVMAHIYKESGEIAGIEENDSFKDRQVSRTSAHKGEREREREREREPKMA